MKSSPFPAGEGNPGLGMTGEDSSRGAGEGGRLTGASGSIPDMQKSTENFQRPLHICLPNAAGSPGQGRSREIQTSKCRQGGKMRIGH